jgi:argininosuccinate lyase
VTQPPPEGYLGADARITSGPAPELVEAGYALEIADAPLLHRGLTIADLAHVVALDEAGIVPPAEAAVLLRELLTLLDTPVESVDYDPAYGDAYNARERVLSRRLGETAGWLHTGRTRREAGRIAFRYALRDALVALHQAVAAFAGALVERAGEHAGTIWNDETYGQPAQPSTFGHYLIGFAEEAVRHLERLEAAHRWADRSPGGVGGVGGTRLPLDRARLAALLGFSEPGTHTRDAMWATDGLVDAVVAAAQAATTVDRLAEDLERMTAPAVGYVTLDASVCRASVLMPQKRNPYALAVIRGGAGVLAGRVTGALVTQRTPSARTDNWLYAYGETAGALGLAQRVVALGTRVVATLEIHTDRLAASAGQHFTCATDLTEELVTGAGLDYRTAYRIVGRAVAKAIDEGRGELERKDLDGRLDEDAWAAATDAARIVETRVQAGGAAPAMVRERCAALREGLELAALWAEQAASAAVTAEARLRELARRGGSQDPTRGAS